MANFTLQQQADYLDEAKTAGVQATDNELIIQLIKAGNTLEGFEAPDKSITEPMGGAGGSWEAPMREKIGTAVVEDVDKNVKEARKLSGRIMSGEVNPILGGADFIFKALKIGLSPVIGIEKAIEPLTDPLIKGFGDTVSQNMAESQAIMEGNNTPENIAKLKEEFKTNVSTDISTFITKGTEFRDSLPPNQQVAFDTVMDGVSGVTRLLEFLPAGIGTKKVATETIDAGAGLAPKVINVIETGVNKTGEVISKTAGKEVVKLEAQALKQETEQAINLLSPQRTAKKNAEYLKQAAKGGRLTEKEVILSPYEKEMAKSITGLTDKSTRKSLMNIGKEQTSVTKKLEQNLKTVVLDEEKSASVINAMKNQILDSASKEAITAEAERLIPRYINEIERLVKNFPLETADDLWKLRINFDNYVKKASNDLPLKGTPQREALDVTRGVMNKYITEVAPDLPTKQLFKKWSLLDDSMDIVSQKAAYEATTVLGKIGNTINRLPMLKTDFGRDVATLLAGLGLASTGGTIGIAATAVGLPVLAGVKGYKAITSPQMKRFLAKWLKKLETVEPVKAKQLKKEVEEVIGEKFGGLLPAGKEQKLLKSGEGLKQSKQAELRETQIWADEQIKQGKKFGEGFITKSSGVKKSGASADVEFIKDIKQKVKNFDLNETDARDVAKMFDDMGLQTLSKKIDNYANKLKTMSDDAVKQMQIEISGDLDKWAKDLGNRLDSISGINGLDLPSAINVLEKRAKPPKILDELKLLDDSFNEFKSVNPQFEDMTVDEFFSLATESVTRKSISKSTK